MTSRQAVCDLHRSPCLFPLPQKYWADDTRPYRFVTAQDIKTAFWASEASQEQRLLLGAPPSADAVPRGSEDGSASASEASGSEEGWVAESALTTQK